MATLRSQFASALSTIEINGAKAIRARKAHTEICTLLEEDKLLAEWGVDTVLIGSYGRDTGIYPGKDVDVFVKLTNLTTSAMPDIIYKAVEGVLVAKYGRVEDGGRVTSQARSIKVAFPDPDDASNIEKAFAVDAVPAVRNDRRWSIPSRDRGLWATGAERWITTDPERLGTLSSNLSTASWSPEVGGQNAYKPVVKLLRQIRRTHVGENKPGGLYLELTAYSFWSRMQVSGTEWDPLLATTLRLVAERLSSARSDPLIDPALDTPYSPAPTIDELSKAAAVFEFLASRAREALGVDDCEAAVIWRAILGSNARAPSVFPLPRGCTEDGRRIPDITAVRRSGPDEARPFG